MPLILQKENRLAYTGSWIDRKGVGHLTTVMSRVLSQDQTLHFDVFGTGGNRGAVLVGFPAALHDRITVHGRLSNAELAASLAKAKVFFFPTQYEGFGMALAEAMACSCAAVTTRTGFGAELRDGREALLCDFSDVEGMEQALWRLLRDEELRAKIARSGWERIQTLRWDANVKRLEGIYSQWVSKFKQGDWKAASQYCYAS
jgi:glycosyltransferase involved in cell wall biosynthesis